MGVFRWILKAVGWAVGGLIALLLVLGLFFWGLELLGLYEPEDEEDDVAEPSDVSGETVDDTADDVARPTSAGVAMDFSEAAIVRSWVQGDQADAYVIAPRADGDMERLAVDCVDALRSADGIAEAYCFVFATEAAFDAAQAGSESPGMRNLCWAARAGAGVSDERPYSTLNEPPIYDTAVCPPLSTG